MQAETVSFAAEEQKIETTAQKPDAIKLPQPQTEGGMPLMEALKNRKTSRSYSSKELPDQVLSNLLWAAFGINRPDGKRTAPSAMNWQEIDIYVSMAKGLYLYNAKDYLRSCGGCKERKREVFAKKAWRCARIFRKSGEGQKNREKKGF